MNDKRQTSRGATSEEKSSPSAQRDKKRPSSQARAHSGKHSLGARGWVPDQHGAWAMVTLPLLVGIVCGDGVGWVHIALVVCWFSGYFAYFAACLWLKVNKRRKAQFVRPLSVYGIVCLISLLILIACAPWVLWWAIPYCPLVALALWEAYKHRQRSVLSGLSTIIASCLTILVAPSVKPITGNAVLAQKIGEHFLAKAGIGLEHWPGLWHVVSIPDRLWAVTFLFALYYCGTLLYVKTLIRRRGDLGFARISVCYHCVCVVIALGVMLLAHANSAHTVVVVVAFILVAARSWYMPWSANTGRCTWTPKVVGKSEVIWTLLVLVALLS